MKKRALVSALAITIAIGGNGQSARSMERGTAGARKVASHFDAAQSVALFVGARTFSEDDSLETVP